MSRGIQDQILCSELEGFCARTACPVASLGGERLGEGESCTSEIQQGYCFREPWVIPALTKAVRA